FMTKPSILSNIDIGESLFVLNNSIILLTLIVAGAGFLLSIAGVLLRLIFRKAPSWIEIASLAPGFVLAAWLFIILNNFTHTLFGFYVGNFQGLGRFIYAGLFLLLWWYATRRFINWGKFIDNKGGLVGPVISLILISLSLLWSVSSIDSSQAVEMHIDNKGNKPNILILSSDGVNADHTSVYGYQRDTTPFLRTLAKESLLSLNSFSNAANTTGSITSFLSGRLPTTTRVIYRPDILRGYDAYLHLPAMLEKQGYSTFDVSIEYYASTKDLNFRGAFEQQNKNSPLAVLKSRLLKNLGQGYDLTLLFIESITDRNFSRLGHAFGLLTIQDVFLEVTDPTLENSLRDRERVDEIKKLIVSAEQPYFINAHLMNTHGEKFKFENPFFSKGQQQDQEWMVDFYDDAILQFDAYVKEIYETLRSANQLEQTIIIVTSDHGHRFTTSDRIPLLIRFPNAAISKVIDYNTQRIDIAPTLLDYLNYNAPNWMVGDSLLLDTPQHRDRHIIGTRTRSAKQIHKDIWEVADSHPPYYSLGEITVVHCDTWYGMKVDTGIILKKTINTPTEPCENPAEFNELQAKSYLLTHLRDAGYKVPTIMGAIK
ncbi:MAG: sulfatase-like hydrolase/transferase, partial [Methylococcales bacterium]